MAEHSGEEGGDEDEEGGEDEEDSDLKNWVKGSDEDSSESQEDTQEREDRVKKEDAKKRRKEKKRREEEEEGEEEEGLQGLEDNGLEEDQRGRQRRGRRVSSSEEEGDAQDLQGVQGGGEEAHLENQLATSLVPLSTRVEEGGEGHLARKREGPREEEEEEEGLNLDDPGPSLPHHPSFLTPLGQPLPPPSSQQDDDDDDVPLFILASRSLTLSPTPNQSMPLQVEGVVATLATQGESFIIN